MHLTAQELFHIYKQLNAFKTKHYRSPSETPKQTPAPFSLAFSRSWPGSLSSNPVMISPSLPMPMLVLHEKLLVDQVSSECDCRDAEAGEGALEAVPAAEGAGVAPRFTARGG